MVEEEAEVAGAADVTTNVAVLAVGVLPVLPPSAPRSRGARGVVAPWWGSPPTKSAKVCNCCLLAVLYKQHLMIRSLTSIN